MPTFEVNPMVGAVAGVYSAPTMTPPDDAEKALDASEVVEPLDAKPPPVGVELDG